MAAIMGLDAGWNAVGHYDAILDPRSNICQPLIAPHAAVIQRHSGGLTTQLEKMLYWRDYLPETYARLDKFVGINAFVAGKLAGLPGEAAFTDQTFGMVNGLMDAVAGEWEPGLVDTFGVPREKLPRILAPHDVVGTLAPGLARELGLPTGVQILAGAGDGAATYAGSGMRRPGQALELSGTACAFGVYSDKFLPDVEQQLFLNLKSPTTPGWYVIYVNQFGRTHRWFIDTFCQDLITSGDIHAAYAVMDEQAAALPPGAGGVFAIPHWPAAPRRPSPSTAAPGWASGWALPAPISTARCSNRTRPSSARPRPACGNSAHPTSCARSSWPAAAAAAASGTSSRPISSAPNTAAWSTPTSAPCAATL
jgi:xylulokinase